MVQVVAVLLLLCGMTIVVGLMEKHLSSELSRRILWLCFTVYVLGNLFFTTLSRIPGSGVVVDLRPFRTYLDLEPLTLENYNNATDFLGWLVSGTTRITGGILNVLLFYPLGYLLPVLFTKIKLRHVILIGFFASVATELIQYLLKMGWCETDDVMHNTLGTVIGVWVWRLQRKRENMSLQNETFIQEK